MDVAALLDHALEAVQGNQAELARRLGRSETTVSRWRSGKNGIDLESALALARIVNMPLRSVLKAAGFDPDLLNNIEPRELTIPQRDVLRRMQRVEAAIDAADGLPDDFVEVYLRKILDNTEADIYATIDMVMRLRKHKAGRVSGRKVRPVGNPDTPDKGTDSGPSGSLPVGYWDTRPNTLAVAGRA